ncbi:TerD family protein [Streptomyces sp. AK02-01A]|uniref:TerD family protein n=1 Tax=Streptomyces sp. AK02-01A TaxID=3028648 RepID=UPI0029B07078|nr:TerD family protein [Streptomyces sp. AK02-01A]MDX3851987.1 TerD family protein [Streptomyces sp. AK02-01A]
MSSLNRGVAKVEVTLKWDPSPLGESAHDLDVVAATFTSDDPTGKPAYLVYFGSRSPDGTITLDRESRTGQGFGSDEEMTLELDRLAPAYTRVVVGVAIQQRDGRLTFGDIDNPSFRVLEGYTELAEYDFSGVTASTAATVAEFTRDAGSGAWRFRVAVRGFDADPQSFGALMGGA